MFQLLLAAALCASAGGKVARVKEANPKATITLSASAASGGAAPSLSVLPEVPLQFYGILVTVAHLLNKTEEYPPWRRRIEIHYDYVNKRARSFVLEGIDANKTFLRRWDTKDEYMYRTGGDFPVCRRAFLSEPMAHPSLSGSGARPLGGSWTVNGRRARKWLAEDFPSRQIIAVDEATGVPLSLTDEFFEEPGAGAPLPLDYTDMDVAQAEVPEPPTAWANTWAPVMTYTWESLHVGPPESWPVPQPVSWDVPPPYTHRKCIRHMGGWPPLHVFHTFLRT